MPIDASNAPSGNLMPHEKLARGIVTEDPLTHMPIGASIAFETIAFEGSNATPVPQGVDNWTFFEGALLAVCVRTAAEERIVGTAAIIAPGLAISATHVISDDMPALLEGKASLTCFGVATTGLHIWRVGKFNVCDSGDDICFLSLELASALTPETQLRKFALTTRVPTVDEVLHVVGFQLPNVTRVTASVGFHAGGALYLAAGTVTAVYPCGRDKLLLPYASIEIACGTLCGMSGGAVLDGDGRLVGIISRGWDLPDGDGPSYAAWVVGALNREVEVTWPAGLYPQPARLLDIDHSALRIEGRERIQIGAERPNEPHIVIGSRSLQQT